MGMMHILILQGRPTCNFTSILHNKHITNPWRTSPFSWQICQCWSECASGGRWGVHNWRTPPSRYHDTVWLGNTWKETAKHKVDSQNWMHVKFTIPCKTLQHFHKYTVGGLLMFDQVLYCLLVAIGKLYFTGDVPGNMTWSCGMTTTVVTLQDKWMPWK